MLKIFRIIVCASLSFCFVCIFNSHTVFAYTASLSTSSMVTVDVSATGDNASLGTDNVIVDTTCPNGYTLSIAGPSNNNLYKGGDSSSSSYISASSGTTASPASILGNNLGTWGYSVANNTTVNSNFVGLTSTTTNIFTKNSASATGGDTIPVYYGISVDTSIEPGAYYMANSGAVAYYLTMNCVNTYTVQYNGNNADSGISMGVTHDDVAENDEIELYAANYKRDGYGFAGWSTEQINPDAVNAATLVSSATIYGPNENIVLDSNLINTADSNNLITLYAVWIKPASGATLQGWTGCSSLAASTYDSTTGTITAGDVIALTDSRDNNVYAVARLTDGECWMIENLRLDAANSYDESKAQGFGGVFSGLATSETGDWPSGASANSLYKSDGSGDVAGVNGATQSDIGTANHPEKRFPRYDNSNTNSTVATMTATNQNIYSYGNSYSLAATMANTSSINEDNSNSFYTSICPYGWYVPRSGDEGTFGALSNSLGGYKDENNIARPTNSSTIPTASEMLKRFRSFPNNFIGDRLAYRANAMSLVESTVDSAGGEKYLFVGTKAIEGLSNADSFWVTISFSGRGSVRCVSSKTFTVRFNANGGSGTMNDQNIFIHHNIALNPNTFTAPSGKTFTGWNTAPDGSGTSYGNERIVVDLANAGETIELYAQWKDCYTVIFNSNGASGSMDNQIILTDVSTYLTLNTFVAPPDTRFAGWNTDPDGSGNSYSDGAPVTNLTTTGSSITLFAKWQPIYTVTYNSNNGTNETATQMIDRGSSGFLNGVASFSNGNDYFKGWGVNTTTVTYRPGESFTPTGDLTLYAIWETSTNKTLYNAVASFNRGAFSTSNINTTLTADNSGVYTYDASSFGAASDGGNSSTIYFYRGIISNSGTYGSSGDGANYPNYVKLTTGGHTTCWRIIRTTGSGGVKMIYNGLWGNDTCAKSGNNANAVSGTYFNRATPDSSSSYYGTTGFITYVGYNYESTSYGYNNTSNTTGVDNSLLFTNETASNARDKVENWYNTTIGESYNGFFEPSAGYCNDRTTYTSTSATATATTSTIPYATSSAGVYFGAYHRLSANTSPTLGCPNTTNNDLLTVSNGLSYPVALLTVDEAVLAGNGLSGKEAYNSKSFIASGGTFWTMSPLQRVASGGYTRVFYINSSGVASPATSPTSPVSSTGGIRPVVSIAPGATISGGAGTAKNPWTLGAYTISFNAGDGGGDMDNQVVLNGVSTALSSNTFTAPNGKTFVGWNTAADGSGTSYIDGESITNLASAGGSITLYAQWGISLYDEIASMTKGTQTAANLQATITSSNSGVYTYNSSVFGAATDASNEYNIYYYRGILDNTTGTYGSDGDAMAYPNYVKLGNNTCWRIVRTTGSGGVKMIYNGLWSSNTCAKSTTNAQISSPVTASAFNGTTGTYAQAVLVGYTYDSTYASNTNTSRSLSVLYGSNNSYSGNTTDSTIKGNVDSWYNSNMTGYTSILESNAGYCNDRSLYDNTSPYTLQAETLSIPQYSTSVTRYNFGAFVRNLSTAGNPTLGCPRSTVDLYSTSGASMGNGQLSSPVALLTADEASFAGSGSSTASQGSAYNTKSFLRTGSDFSLLSPSYRNTNGRMQRIYVTANGYIGNGLISASYGVRPVISLKHGVAATSGTGTATDPWIVNAP